MEEKQKEHRTVENTATAGKANKSPSLKVSPHYQFHSVIPYRHKKKHNNYLADQIHFFG